ncbi:hypothetical protein D3C87_826310 [compost metagenome]
MSQDLSSTSLLIASLLTEKSPELGARLKQRLNIAFQNDGLGRFDEKAFGFTKFRDFLEKALPELVSVEPPVESGDIVVTLRKSANTSLPSSSASTDRPESPVIRSDIWQAFSNPDPKRKRYFQKSTGKLIHFLVTAGEDHQATIDATPSDYAEITPINGDLQLHWMKTFLSNSTLPPAQKATMEAFLDGPYSSDVNSIFSRALGAAGAGWPKYRTRLIYSNIHEWTEVNNIKQEELYPPARSTPTIAQTATAIPTSPPEQAIPPRQQAIKMLEIMTDEDISRVVMPILVSTLLVRARL